MEPEDLTVIGHTGDLLVDIYARNLTHIYILPQCSTTAARVLNPAGMDAQFERLRCAISRGILTYTHMKAILHKAGLPDMRFHDLRHTFATHAIASGVDAKTLSGILGHTNASFTLDTYTHVTPDMQKAASGIVGGFMEDLLGKGLRPWQINGKAEPAP